MIKKIIFFFVLLAVTLQNSFCLSMEQLRDNYDVFCTFALTQDAAEPNIPEGKTKSLIILEILLSIAAYDHELNELKPHDERRQVLDFVNPLGTSLSDQELLEQKEYLESFIHQLADKWREEL
jgi:hypothetical protein